MTVDTFSISAAGNDAYGQYIHTSYPPNVGGSFTVGGSASVLQVSRQFVTPNYITQKIWLRWDTSSLADDQIIVSAFLRITFDIVLGTEGMSLTADWYDYGGDPETSADFADTGTNAHAGTLKSAITSGIDQDFALINLENINKSGFTGLRLHMAGAQPTTNSNQFQAKSFAGGGTVARLLVDHRDPILTGGFDTDLSPKALF